MHLLCSSPPLLVLSIAVVEAIRGAHSLGSHACALRLCAWASMTDVVEKRANDGWDDWDDDPRQASKRKRKKVSADKSARTRPTIRAERKNVCPRCRRHADPHAAAFDAGQKRFGGGKA